MDGQRRLAQSLSNWLGAWLNDGRDCLPIYRVAMRTGAALGLSLALVHGAVQGGHLNGADSLWHRLPGKLAGIVGQAADDIEISGLEHHDSRLVLKALHIIPGGSLFGFSPDDAKKRLEALDWVMSAAVRREFPNRLLVSLVERQPFAIWQIDGNFRVIDRTGVVMSGIDPSKLDGVLTVTGTKANEAVGELVNQLEALPDLRMKVRAASRVGQRRWNLYLDGGTKILLPAVSEGGEFGKALALAQTNGLLSGAAAEIDLRVLGYMRISAAIPEPVSPETTSSISTQEN
jgi:cell division protein FtsQ